VAYYVKSGDRDVEGPYEEAALIAAITQKVVSSKALINRAGAPSWEALTSHPPFAEAVRRRSRDATIEPSTLGRSIREEAVATLSSAPMRQHEQTVSQTDVRPIPRQEPPDDAWVRMGAVGAWVAAALVAVVAVLLAFRLPSERAERAEAAEHATALEARLAALDGHAADLARQVEHAGSAKLVDFESTTRSCGARNEEAQCTFTNASSEAIATCWEAQLVLKTAAGVAIKSLPVCTGRLGPHETRVVHAPWLQAHADTICKSTGRLGDVLDWSTCEFKVTTVPPGR
jgi:type II secretory pathway pseudopilin PulG